MLSFVNMKGETRNNGHFKKSRNIKADQNEATEWLGLISMMQAQDDIKKEGSRNTFHERVQGINKVILKINDP